MAWAFLEAIFGSSGAVKAAEELEKNEKLAARQHLTINIGTEVNSLDPHKSSGIPDTNVLRNLLEGLCNIDRHGETVPGVAERWEESEDGRTWTFYLRRNARWSNGDPVTAHDFVYSWRRLADPKTAAPSAKTLEELGLVNSFAVITGHQAPSTLGIEALDDHTLELQLSQRQPFLVKQLAQKALYPVHRTTVEKYGQQSTLPAHYVGNGAYCIQERKANEKLVLTRNRHYWGNAKTRVDQATLLMVASPKAELMRYRAGELDISENKMPDGNFYKLQQEFSQEVRLFPSLDIYGVLLNNKVPPFHDVRVRRALALVIDRETLAKCDFMKGKKLAYSVIPDGVGGVKVKLPAWAAWSQARRLQEAQKLLQEVGYSARNPLCFSYLYNTSELHQEVALLLRNQWQAALPVKVTLENQEWNVFQDSIRFGRYQVGRLYQTANYNEPYALIGDLRSSSKKNDARYHSQRFDDYLDQILRTVDNATRLRYYRQAESELEQDMPWIPLMHPASFRLVKPHVGGFSDHSPPEIVSIKDLYVIEH